jgi:dipeptidyl aminopeptidase/acylaminoacyl peptidase
MRLKKLRRLTSILPLAALLGASGATNDPVIATRIALRKAMRISASKPRQSLVAREAYLRRASIVDVQLSPKGNLLSFLRRNERGVDVVLQDVTSGAQTRIVAGLQRAETAWSGDGHYLWLADEQGLAVIESSSRRAKRVLRWDTRRSQEFWAVDPRAPHYAVIHEKVVQQNVESHRYLTVDERGRLRLLLESTLPLRSALLRADGSLAFTAGFEGPRYETVVREYTGAQSREILRCDTLEECRLVGFNRAQQTVWLLSNHNGDKVSLRRWHETTRSWKIVHRDPAGVTDADEILWSPSRENWLAIAYHDGRRQWFGNGIDSRTSLKALERKLPDANLHFLAATDSVWLVRSQNSDRQLDHYYTYRPQHNQLDPLFSGENASTNSAPHGVVMHAVSYRAHDGMLLHGYVLLPSGAALDKVPLIAWVHGGPITREYDRYEGSMQLLVNRGYAVFVPNFRGSTGYGAEYIRSIKGDVGNGLVLQDIMDGMDFLLNEGIGDRKRQAIMGMSFGGYASLLAVSFHPARFRFAFAGAAPTDYGWIKQWQAEHDSEALRADGPPLALQFPQLGFRYTDAAWREKMRRESPMVALRSVQAPVYIWAGARDDHVPLKSIVSYVGEARRLGRTITVLIDPDGGHGPTTLLGTDASLYMIELAAHRHFGGALSWVSPELREFLRRNLRTN